MIDQESDHHVSQLLDELGAGEPPADFTASVMARIVSERPATNERIVPFKKEGIAMTRKVMWGLAAAAAVTLAVFAVKGFPPVGRGTEGTIGAAKKYQAPQIANKDVVLGDAAAQEFLQSEEFDHLMKDPDARSLLTDAALKPYLRDARFVDAIRDRDVRAAIGSKAVAEIYASAAGRAALEAEIKAQIAGTAARQASADVVGKSSARAMVAQALSDRAIAGALKRGEVRAFLADAAVHNLLRSSAAAAAMRGDVLARAAAHNGFKDANLSGRLDAALSAR